MQKLKEDTEPLKIGERVAVLEGPEGDGELTDDQRTINGHSRSGPARHKNTKPLYQQLTQEGNQIVFNMELDVSNCEFDKITRTRKPLMVEQTTCTQILKAPGLKVHKTLVKIEDNLDCDCMNHKYQKRILNRINCC